MVIVMMTGFFLCFWLPEAAHAAKARGKIYLNFTLLHNFAIYDYSAIRFFARTG